MLSWEVCVVFIWFTVKSRDHIVIKVGEKCEESFYMKQSSSQLSLSVNHSNIT